MTTREAWDHAKMLGLVAFITALVWLMAEGESLRIDKPRTEILFRTKPDSGRIIRIEPNQEFTGTVTLTVEGPTASVDALAARVRSGIDLEPGMEGVPGDPGLHTINLADALRSHHLFRDGNVAISSVDPPSATVWVDNLVMREARVRVETPEGTQLDGQPEPTPAVVMVRLPESVARTAGDFAATVKLAPDVLATLAEGRRATVTAPVTLPQPVQQEAVRVTPGQVRVTLTLRSRVETASVAGVPVYLRLAPAEAGAWDIELAPEHRTLADVTVSGPADVVEQIRAQKLKLIGYVALSAEDLERAAASGQPLEKEVCFSDLPIPLHVEAKPRTVKVTVKRREGAATLHSHPS